LELSRGVAFLFFVCWQIAGQQFDPLDLTRPKSFEARRSSSTNPDLKSNDDSKRPIPGETIVLADLQGPGAVTHIWITSSNTEYGWPRLFRLQVFYDGSATPSVDAPIGDFFASGHGLERDVNSQMVRVSSSGRSRNSYWPMPFRKSCRITVTNEGTRRPNSFYYQVDWKKLPSLPADTLYFHALYRQAIPAQAGSLYDLLEVRGRGHYIGTVFSVIQTQPGWFGEGDESFFIDGAVEPALHGTGTEDYFGDAYALHVSAGLYAGTTIADGSGTGARMTAYRWHVLDPIPYQRSLRFGFEHAGFVLNSDGSVKASFDERPDFFSSVAFWYQQGVAAGLPAPPYGSRRLPHGNAMQIAAEPFRAQGIGDERQLPFDIPQDDRYEVLLQFARGPAFGQYEVELDGQILSAMGARDDEPTKAARVRIDGYSAESAQAREQVLAWAQLTRGGHKLLFRCVGKAAASERFDLGMEGLVLARVGGVAAEPAEAAKLRSSHSLAELQRGLTNSDAEVRAAAAWALGQMGSGAARASADLVRALSDSDAIVRGLAAVAFREAGPAAASAIPALIAGLKDGDSSVRMICAEALGRMKAAAAVPALIAVSQKPDEHLHVLRNVVAAFGEIGPGAAPAIPALEALKSNPRLRYPAAAAQEKILKRP
jgi:hypothetical protein